MDLPPSAHRSGARFRQNEVSVKRIGRKVILEPLDEWPEVFRACLGAWHDPIERPRVEAVDTQPDPFDA